MYDFIVGLSLCVQGTLNYIPGVNIELRFIPMCIGNTLNMSSAFLHCSVYPYVYREHKNQFQKKLAKNGLSLCVQGTLDVKNISRREERFIPMCIGNTYKEKGSKVANTVYPYVYREHMFDKRMCDDDTGLSLCVQGTLMLIMLIPVKPRFIPMCIGNTKTPKPKITDNAVYPYVYRQHSYLASLRCQRHGLSLCVQGTQ